MDALRTVLIFLHLIVFAFAISKLYISDFNLFFRRSNLFELQLLGRQMSFLLGGLWITGAGVVFIDTSFDPVLILASDKLLAKLVCVSVLTINATLIHNIVFKKAQKAKLSYTDMLVMTIPGAISTCSWTFAGFLGVARPLSEYLSFQHFLILYGVCLFLAIALMVFISPIIRRNWSEKGYVKGPLSFS
jgi:hypothetical protein